MALLTLKENILQSFEYNCYTAGIFIDCSKAFDSLDDEILIHKCFLCRFRWRPRALFKSYLKERNKCVSINNHKSSYLPVVCCVPKGSILVPLSLNVFINDVNIANDAKFITYADDCTLCVSGPDANKLVKKCNEIMVSLSNWTRANRLKVNTNKTKVIMFCAKNKLLIIRNDIYFQNHRIELVEELKILGVYFSSGLRWDARINYLCGKLSAVTGVMARCRAFLPVVAKLQIYYGVFLSYVHYCYFVWATISKCNMQKLLTIQKKIVRYIENVDLLSVTHGIFVKHKSHRVGRFYEGRLLE